MAPKIQVSWSLIDTSNQQVYHKEPAQDVPHGETRTIDLTGLLKASADTRLVITATASNHELPYENSITISSVEMYLQHPSSYSPFTVYNSTGLNFTVEAVGKLSKILECKVDGNVAFTETIAADGTKTRSISIDSKYCSHGYHKVEVNLYQNIGTSSKPIANENAKATPLIFEVATKENGNQTPIIWLGGYQSTYYQYDTI